MRKRVILFLLLFLFQGVEAYSHEVDLTVTIYTDRLIYSSGETMKLFVGANNKDLPIEVDAYIAIQAPDGTLYFLTDITSTTFVRFNPLDSGTIKPLATLLLPSGLILPDSPILTSPLPLPMMPIMTQGIYTWFFALTEAGTLEILGMSTTSFTIKPASVKPSVKLTMPQDYLLGTEHLDLFLELRAGGIKFDLYLYMTNDIDQISLYHGPEGDFTRERVPSPLKLGDGKVMLFGLDSSNPPPLIGELWLPHHGMGGPWTWTAELVEPGSGEIISKSEVSFFVEDLPS